MKNDLDILLVNPHLEFPPDTSGRSGHFRSREYLLNAGLLSIATYLKSIGIDTVLCDLTTVDNPKRELGALVRECRPKFVGISNQSCHSYLSTMRCANIAKSIDKDIKIIVGGLHASGIPKVLLRECSAVDVVIVGDGELVIADLIKGTNTSGCRRRTRTSNRSIIDGLQPPNLNDLPSPDYTLYPNYRLFVPYIEESRGCNFKCAYCISPTIHRGIRFWHPETIASNLTSLQNLYGREGFHTFIEANNFATSYKRTKALAELLANSNASWRVESRSDTFPISLLDPLVDAGLRVLDIGLESGSPEMLLRMNKTKDPRTYLDACVKIAEKIAANGKCLLKLNIMLYYGESTRSIKTTRDYLKLISSICPLSLGIGPVRMEPGSKLYRNGVQQMDLSRFENTFWGKVHCYPIDLSEEISFETANKICLEIAQEFQTSKAYFEAKRHSQLRYDITYEEFMEQSEKISANERQWRI
ncbi:MAG TPA: radical SAM protein [Candidatus Saccharimonadales bacterium]|nr:radical SAM protein [Candidatus Saccharimonadales bacterium]